MNYNYKLGVIGAGNMAKAIVSGVVKSGLFKPETIAVSDPNSDIGIDGVVNLKDNRKLAETCEFLLFAVKPQIFKQINHDFIECKSKAVISIMAGLTTNYLKTVIPPSTSVIRVMPNTPCMVGSGMSCIAANDKDSESVEIVKEIFASVGEVTVLDESLFDAVTSLSGSGPAYVYLFIDGMIKSGVKSGLPYAEARKMAYATARGAAEMVAINANKTLDDLTEAVCSKGGTTIEAVKKFKEQSLEKIIDDAMIACKNRSEELGKI